MHTHFFRGEGEGEVMLTSASCDKEISTKVFAAGWTTSKSFIMVAPSFEMVVFPERREKNWIRSDINDLTLFPNTLFMGRLEIREFLALVN